MAIPTSRFSKPARISINRDLCTGCGLCVEVCKDFGLVMRDGKAEVKEEPLFGCLGCGHCAAICPTGAISVLGRDLSPDSYRDLSEIPPPASFESLYSLLIRRRSIREFDERPVEKEKIDQILKAASTAPMGLPPSDVHLLVMEGREKTKQFSRDFCRYLKSIRWMTSSFFMALMRPFWGKENDALFRAFVKPLFKIMIESSAEGKDYLLYEAPLAIYFYSTPYADPADPLIAATYAMEAGESLGLGTCMIGSVHPLIQTGGKAKKFRMSHGIKYKSREGVIVIFGYPAVKYGKAVKRSFASIEYL